MEDEVAVERCPLYAQGYCWRGSQCLSLHSPTRTIRSTLNPVSHLDKGKQRAPSPEPEHDELVCIICYEHPEPGSRWGLLDACQHSFCLECIEQWRKIEGKNEEQIRNAKACPMCRVESTIIIPSDEFLRAGPSKDAARTAQLDLMSRTPCPHFLASPAYSRHCPKGTDCLYHHATSASLPAHLFTHTHADTLRAEAAALERAQIDAEVRMEVQRRALAAQLAGGNPAAVRQFYANLRNVFPPGQRPWEAMAGMLGLEADPEIGDEEEPTESDEDEDDDEEESSEDEDWESEEGENDDDGDDEDDIARPPPPRPRADIPNPMRRPLHPRAQPAPPPPPPAPAPAAPESDDEQMPALEDIDTDSDDEDSDDGLPPLEDVDDDLPPPPPPPPILPPQAQAAPALPTDSDSDSEAESDDAAAGMPPLVSDSDDADSDDSDAMPALESESSSSSEDEAAGEVVPLPLFARPVPAPEPEVEVEVPVVQEEEEVAGRNPEMLEARERAARAAERRVVEARWEDVD
ncbi:hypothetical protein RQP46_002885 [Phenoliferia psychrophenolica]